MKSAWETGDNFWHELDAMVGVLKGKPVKMMKKLPPPAPVIITSRFVVPIKKPTPEYLKPAPVLKSAYA